MLQILSPHTFVCALFLVLLLIAAGSDLRHLRIPNWIVVAILVLYPLHAWPAGPSIAWAAAVGGAALVFVVGALLFATGAMGGGDVKLLRVGFESHAARANLRTRSMTEAA